MCHTLGYKPPVEFSGTERRGTELLALYAFLKNTCPSQGTSWTQFATLHIYRKKVWIGFYKNNKLSLLPFSLSFPIQENARETNCPRQPGQNKVPTIIKPSPEALCTLQVDELPQFCGHPLACCSSPSSQSLRSLLALLRVSMTHLSSHGPVSP